MKMATGGKNKISMEKWPGWRLSPLDEEIIYHYLSRKLQGLEEDGPLPELDPYTNHPLDILKKFNELSDLGFNGQECIFFCRLIKYKSNKIKRTTKGGFWKETGKGRDPQETDQIKWSKKTLVYYTGNQKNKIKTDFAMQEFMIISDQRFVVCCLHKIKPKNIKVKGGPCSSGADSVSNPITPDFSGISNETSDMSSEGSASVAMDLHNLPPASDINQPMYGTPVPQQKHIAAEGRVLPSLDTYNNSLHLKDLRGPIYPPILIREQSPCCENTFLDEGYNRFESPRDTPEGGVEQFINHQVPTDQSSNDVSMGFLSPPQQSQMMMPTEKILPRNTDTSFNASGNTYSQLDSGGLGAQVPALPSRHGSHVMSFKEVPHFTVDEQNTVSAPNSSLISHEQWQELSEGLNIQPSSECSEGRGSDAINFGQFASTNLEVPRDIVDDFLNAIHDSEIEALLNSFVVNSPPPDLLTGMSGTFTGGYSDQ